MTEQDSLDLEKFKAFIVTVIKKLDVPAEAAFVTNAQRVIGYSAIRRASGISNFLLERIIDGKIPRRQLSVVMGKIRDFNQKYIK